jgi:hypothetical protein
VWLQRFCEWLAATPGSAALHESLYLYLVVLSVHVLTLCLFVGTAVILDLRLMGWTMQQVPVSKVMSWVLPRTWAGLVVMVVSGALLFYAAPVQRYHNIFFRAKMITLVLAAVNIGVFHRKVYPGIAEWDSRPVPPRGARVAGGVALVLWALLIVLGRMIPYQVYWFDCDAQPQPAILNLLTGCEAGSR